LMMMLGSLSTANFLQKRHFASFRRDAVVRLKIDSPHVVEVPVLEICGKKL
jgi:hypothetical protein